MTLARDLANTANDKSIVQMVAVSYDVTKDYTTSTYVDTGLTATITPTSASNKILVFVNLPIGSRLGAGSAVKSRLLRNSTTIVQLSTFGQAYISTAMYGFVNAVYLDSPATTSAVTYKTQAANNANQNYISTNEDLDGQATSSILLMEVTP
jgi:hypothetical protein